MPDTIRTADRVRALVAEHLGVPVENATDDAELSDDLGADSLDAIELSIALEEAFGIPEITDEEVERWTTVGDIVRTVEGKR